MGVGVCEPGVGVRQMSSEGAIMKQEVQLRMSLLPVGSRGFSTPPAEARGSREEFYHLRNTSPGKSLQGRKFIPSVGHLFEFSGSSEQNSELRHLLSCQKCPEAKCFRLRCEFGPLHRQESRSLQEGLGQEQEVGHHVLSML